MATINMHHGDRWSGKGNYQGYKTYASMKRLIDYVTDVKKHKTREDLIKGMNCDPSHAYEEFLLSKEIYKKPEDGNRRMCIHFSQDFKTGEDITPELASEIAEQLLQHEMFQGFQVLYATHIDAGHVHTHFVINTVNLETGAMWHSNKNDLQKLKDYSDELCRKYNLSVCEKPEQKRVYRKKDEMEVEARGRSWKEEIHIAATLCADEALSRPDFISKMADLGIRVNWSDNRKYIVFIDQEGHRVRNIRLEPIERFTKESLEQQFLLNRQMEEMQRLKEQEAAAEKIELYPGVRGILYMAKTIMQSGQAYPLQNSGEIQAVMNRAKTETAWKDYKAEQRKGRGI